VDLESLCGEIVEEWQFTLDSQPSGAKSTPPTIVFSAQGDDTQANLDEKLLRQILTTLLSNAVKFSPQGGVVSFDLVGQPGQAIFRIRDEGIGIPTEERERLFELFYRASNVGTIQGRDWV
jgi:signal transduction histidine kinase